MTSKLRSRVESKLWEASSEEISVIRGSKQGRDAGSSETGESYESCGTGGESSLHPTLDLEGRLCQKSSVVSMTVSLHCSFISVKVLWLCLSNQVSMA